MINSRGVVLSAAWCLISVQAWAQDSVLRSLPRVESLYERRAANARAGNLPPVFHGSASVVPATSQTYTVSLGLPGLPQQRGHFCGGVIVDPRWVLTAAHCVSEMAKGERSLPRALEGGKLQILAGTTVLYRGGQVRPVTRVIIHPDYKLTAAGVPENDLALLQFADALPGRPIPVVSDADAQTAARGGERIGVFGWGTAQFSEQSPISTNLLYAFVETVDRNACNKVYGGAVTDRMFCAGLGFADACQGDSGGPAITYDDENRTVLVGITSWGAGCTQRKYPGVYVNVAAYRGWIHDTIAIGSR